MTPRTRSFLRAHSASVMTPTLRAALVAVWAWGTINAVSSAPSEALPPPPDCRFAGPPFEPSAAAFDPVTRRVLVDDATLEAAVRALSGLPWSRIDALAVDRTGTKVPFGVRRVGETYEPPRDVVLVVRCPLVADRVGAPEEAIRLSAPEALGGLGEFRAKPEGLAIEPSCALLMVLIHPGP